MQGFVAIVFGAATMWIWSAVLAAQPRVLDVTLGVTVRQQEQGKLDRGLHVLELRCFDGHCSLTSISLNQCAESGEGKLAFYPKVQRSATSEGNLVVTREGRTLVVRESESDWVATTLTTSVSSTHHPQPGVRRRN